MTRSIRSHLLSSILGAVVLFGVTILAFTWLDTRSSTNEMFDLRLQREAQMLVMVAKEEHSNTSEGMGLVPGSAQHLDLIVYESDMAVQVWIAGQLRAQTEGTPGFAAPSEPGFSDVVFAAQPWRILYLGEDFAAETGGTVPIWVAVGEPWSDRNSVINRMLWQSSLPLAGIVLLLAIVLYTGVGRALQPLQRLRNQIARRSPKSLKPMRAEQAPMELKPVIDAINDLLRKLDVALEREKQFTADAAHELRTPLGALKAQAQVALRESDAERRSVALQNLVLGVERATHLVNQLLTIARLDPGRTELRDSSFALVPGLEEVLADLAPEAQERGVELRLERACDGVAVKGDKVLIQTMLRNIVHNAIVYAPEKVGAVTVHARLVENGCRISVIDNGPGIPKTERERVFDRFYRIPGNSSFGAGLGLSIASRVAGLHETELRIEENPAGTGLCVSVQLQIDGDADAVPRMRPGNRRRVA